MSNNSNCSKTDKVLQNDFQQQKYNSLLELLHIYIEKLPVCELLKYTTQDSKAAFQIEIA
jgi:hypothetical protein